MKLKKHVIICLLVLFGCSFLAAYCILKFHTFSVFKQIEIEELRERNHQIARSIFNELEKVALIGRDWAKWDDSYEFIEDVNKEYIRSNLTESTLEDLALFSMQYLGVDFKDRYHLVRNEDLSLFSLLSKQVLAKKEILLDTAGGEGKLLYNEEEDIFFWVVVQMVTDSREMKTANGYLVMIKLIDPTFFQKISTIIGVPIKIVSVHDRGLDCFPGCEDNLYCERINFLDCGKASLLINFADEGDRHHLLLESFVFRSLHQQLEQLLTQTLLALAVVGGLIVIAIAMILKRSVLSPLAEVANNFEHYAGRGDLSNRLKVSGPFEIKQLAASANIMLDEIQSLNEQLQEMAQVDDLTGLLNKRYFYELYFCQFERAKRNGLSVGIVMTDIDQFKQYNDCYGHLGGDECLRQVAGLFRQTFSRSTDILARFGGEEFVAVLDNISVSDLELLCISFSIALEKAKIKHEKSRVSSYVTCSIGALVVVPQETLDSRTILSQVDELLYRAKKNGRNRIELEVCPDLSA